VGRTADTSPQTLGVSVSRSEGTTAKLSGAFVRSLAELSCAFAVQVIEPGIHRLVEEGAQRRRRWMDWAVFHVEPNFIAQWSSYMRALKQRNAALRFQPELASTWNPELIRLGESIAAARALFIQELQPYWTELVSKLVGLEISLSHAKGWAEEISLDEALSATQGRDIRRGMTHVGPHRADVILQVGKSPAKEILSRGQQKLAAVAMTLAQLRLIQASTGTVPTLLLDDPAAELDRLHLERFAEEVRALKCQLLVTSLSPQLDPLGVPDQVFHVERGRVARV